MYLSYNTHHFREEIIVQLNHRLIKLINMNMDKKLIFRKPELIGIRKLKNKYFFPLRGLEMLTSNIYVHFRRACACAERTLCAFAATLPRGDSIINGYTKSHQPKSRECAGQQ